MSRQAAGFRILVVVWTILSILTQALGQASRGTSGGGDGVDMSQLMTDFEEGNAIQPNHPYYSLTPSTPSPDEINCFIEVLTVTPIGGRCVPLGRRVGRRTRGGRRRTTTWGCQSGVHLSLSQECQNHHTRGNRRD